MLPAYLGTVRYVTVRKLFYFLSRLVLKLTQRMSNFTQSAYKTRRTQPVYPVSTGVDALRVQHLVDGNRVISRCLAVPVESSRGS